MTKHNISKEVKEDNYKVFALLSNYLNNAPDYITSDDIEELTTLGISKEYAFLIVLATAFGLDVDSNPYDRVLFENYYKRMIHQLDRKTFYENPYYQNIKIPEIKIGNAELTYEKYKPFEAFVCNDIIQDEKGRQIPQIGFFDKEFKFPAILENGRIWMTITPNEIETMKEPIENAFGNVLTFGLGLGYYAYMVSQKDNVESVTIVDSNEEIIKLFQTYILPQFDHPEKIKIEKADAFEFAKQQLGTGSYDFVFTDLWHDVSDGIDMYLKMKKYENLSPKTIFKYWIEKSILCYL